MKTSEEINELAVAMAKFQKEVESPKKSSLNPAFKREGKSLKYADLDAIIKVVSPVLSENGLTQMQFTSSDIEAKTVSVTTLVTHSSGQYIMSDPLVLPAENYGKFNAQTIGSSITYGRRYSLSAILGIASEDDDDANTQSLPKNEPNNNSRPQPKESAVKEPTVNDSIVGYITQIKEMDGDIQSIYADICNVEGKENIKQVDNLKILGHLKTYALTLKRSQNNEAQQEQESLMKQGTTTAKVDWGNA